VDLNGDDAADLSVTETTFTGALVRTNLNDPAKVALREFAAVPIPRGAPLQTWFMARFHIKAPAQKADFDVLSGPLPEVDAFAKGQFDASEPLFVVHAGWVIAGGGYPMVRSDWVRATGRGTRLAMRLFEDAAGKLTHRVFNLSKDSAKTVTVRRDKDEVTLKAGEAVDVPLAGTIPTPAPFTGETAADADYLKAMADAAKVAE
jgi:hypothetical protein